MAVDATTMDIWWRRPSPFTTPLPLRYRFAYNPDVSPYVYACIAVYDGTKYGEANLYVLDPANSYAPRPANGNQFERLPLRRQGRDLALDADGNLYISVLADDYVIPTRPPRVDDDSSNSWSWSIGPIVDRSTALTLASAQSPRSRVISTATAKSMRPTMSFGGRAAARTRSLPGDYDDWRANFGAGYVRAAGPASRRSSGARAGELRIGPVSAHRALAVAATFVGT